MAHIKANKNSYRGDWESREISYGADLNYKINRNIDIPSATKNLQISMINPSEIENFNSNKRKSNEFKGQPIVLNNHSTIDEISKQKYNTPQNHHCGGFKHFKINDPKDRKYLKISLKEMDELFNPKKDKRYIHNEKQEFEEDLKLTILNDISQQYIVDK